MLQVFHLFQQVMYGIKAFEVDLQIVMQAHHFFYVLQLLLFNKAAAFNGRYFY